MKKLIQTITLSIVLLLILCVLTGCGRADTGAGQGAYTSLEELAGKRIGVQMGTIFDRLTQERVPDAKIVYFGSFPDIVVALKSNKIDAFPSTRTVLSQYMNTDDSITLLEEEIGSVPAAYVFPKNEKGRALRDQMNEFLSSMRENGELSRIEDMWCGRDEAAKTILDYRALPDENGRLTFLTEGTFPPYSYLRGDLVVGYDVDVAARFCREYGYALDVVEMSFEALMPAVHSGKCDFAGTGIAITEERAESVYFSEPNIYDRIFYAVLKKDAGSGSFTQSVADGFRKTFITENRYRLFARGIAATLSITVLAVLFGTVLGFALYLACRRGNRFANRVTSIFVWLIRGMPGVVLLMLLYYVIFGRISISGLAVAVIAFTLTFGTAMYGMLVSGVAAVDPGQTKAAYALGFDDRSTFFRLILPQAAQHFLPAYKAEIVALIKATAIVGYITVEDLTRMGDLIRARTYEPFFPIISVAVCYFLLAGALTALVNRLLRGVDPKTRAEEQILKGIEAHD
ncbi:MAG: ABC transporter permease subunit [Oscillospiraceae bacterium]|nr:ABC transporter permease subunit [Oscillospiraceae bacterium]